MPIWSERDRPHLQRSWRAGPSWLIAHGSIQGGLCCTCPAPPAGRRCCFAERVEPVLIVLRAGDVMVAAVVTRAGRKRIDPGAAVDDRAGGVRADDDVRARTRLRCLRH